MAKIKLEGLDAHLKKVVTGAIESLDMQSLAEFIAADVKLQTRLGYGIKQQGAAKEKLKPLSKLYKKQRASMNLSPMTSVNKSNLTQTGEMLDSIEGRVSDEQKIQITFGNQFSRDKAKWNTEKGRPFMNLSKIQILKLKNKVQEMILSYLKKNM